MPSDVCAAHDVTALVLGAGEGQRLGGRPKAFVDYQDQTLLTHSIGLMESWVRHIVVGVRGADLDRARIACAELPTGSRIQCVAGGATRQETLKRLLDRATTPYVLIHEVARPRAQPSDFANLLGAVEEHGAVVLYTPVPVRDAVAVLANGKLEAILPRSAVVTLQTPHAYRRSWLLDAYAAAEQGHWNESSTAALMRRAGYGVHLVEGSPQNVKVTYPEDLVALETPTPLSTGVEVFTGNQTTAHFG